VGRVVRIGLFSDCEGNARALEAALAALRRHGPDLLVCAGDILCNPFSPDPPAETVALLRAYGVLAVPGNHDRYLIDWGTPRWPSTVWMRLRRTDPLRFSFADVAAGQALISSEDLAWLRALPEALVLAGGLVYVCHGMPGNAWNSIWPSSPVYDANVSARDRAAALDLLAASAPAAELVLCGHAPEPREFCERLPDGRDVRIVRAGAQRDHVCYALLTASASGWEVEWGAAAVSRRS
jgi:predicted phosphodiesterase